MTRDKKDNKNRRKERVIHTRVSDRLDQELRDRANHLGVSVSNLVRNVLQNAVDMVDDIVADAGSVARAAVGPSVAAPSANTEVLGWQELTLNVNALCESCNGVLAKGTKAHIAIAPGHPLRVFRCSACLEESNDDTD